MSYGKTIVFFPEGAFGPALNSVGIAQVCKEMGHNPVFVADAGFGGVFEGYGFEEHLISMSEPMEPEAMARYWVDFINGQIPNFRTPPIDDRLSFTATGPASGMAPGGQAFVHRRQDSQNRVTPSSTGRS